MKKLFRKPKTSIYEPPRDARDLRLKHIIRPWKGERADIAIIGVPFDEAIEAGGGRPGAESGPDAIRKAIKRFGTTYFIEKDIDISSIRVVDCGDIPVAQGDIRATHDRLTEAVTWVLESNIMPVIFGGSHDCSFASVRALAQTQREKLGGMNIDAHFDVREIRNGVISSGTPFRRVLEELRKSFDPKRFIELGMTGNANSRAHRQYLEKKGSRIVSLQEFRGSTRNVLVKKLFVQIGTMGFCSIDIDVVGQAFAPGCSAPAPLGMTSEEITAIAFAAGASRNIRLFDIMEVSPRYDVDNRTARLAAAIFSHFLAGFAKRT